MNPELIALATRVLQRALEKSGHLPPHVYDGGELPPPDDPLVDGLAGHLINFVGRMDVAFTTPHTQAGADSITASGERNRRLARALGACDCWGESLSCPTCGGRGESGWKLPDRGEFEALVGPALRKVSRFRLTARNGHLQSTP